MKSIDKIKNPIKRRIIVTAATPLAVIAFVVLSVFYLIAAVFTALTKTVEWLLRRYVELAMAIGRAWRGQQIKDEQ
jgi:hypothetical protein